MRCLWGMGGGCGKNCAKICVAFAVAFLDFLAFPAPLLLFPEKVCLHFGLPASDVLTGVVLAKLSSSVFNYNPWLETGAGISEGGRTLTAVAAVVPAGSRRAASDISKSDACQVVCVRCLRHRQGDRQDNRTPPSDLPPLSLEMSQQSRNSCNTISLYLRPRAWYP